MSATHRDITWALLAVAVAVAAVVVPSLLAFNVPPSATFLNQAAALVGWGFWLAMLVLALPSRTSKSSSGLKALCAVLGVLFVAATTSPFWTHLPSSLSFSSLALIGAAGLAVAIGAALQSAGLGVLAFRAFCIALVAAGVCSSSIGIVQVFAPALADGTWIARSVLDGRAVGNLRQPNHLSSLLLWSLIAAVWLGEARVIDRVGSTVLALIFVFVTVLSASRTGAVGALMLGVRPGRPAPVAPLGLVAAFRAAFTRAVANRAGERTPRDGRSGDCHDAWRGIAVRIDCRREFFRSVRRLMQNDALFDAGPIMRTTLTIDDDLFERAVELAEPGIERSELLKECVKAFIQRQTARRLAALGGQAPDIVLAPRRPEETPAA